MGAQGSACPRARSAPDREPTDEELVEPSREAFAGVPLATELALRALRDQIAAESKNVLEWMAGWKGG